MPYDIESILVDAGNVDMSLFREYLAKREKALQLTSTVGTEGYSGSYSPLAALEVQGADAGIAISQTSNAASKEGFITFNYPDSALDAQKGASLSMCPVDPAAGAGLNVFRINVTKTGGTASDILARFWGGKGVTLFSSSDTDWLGDHKLLVRGEQMLQQPTGVSEDILRLGATDVAHGMTNVALTSVFGRLSQWAGGNGGLYVDGLTASGATGMTLRGVCVSPNAVRSTSGLGSVMIWGAKKSGANAVSIGANQNLLAVTDNGTAQFFLDSDGNSYQNVGVAWTNFDDKDDIALLQDLSVAVSRAEDPIKKTFRRFLKYNRPALERAGLVTFNRDGQHFVNMSKLTMAHTGAIRQLGGRFSDLRDEVSDELGDVRKKFARLDRIVSRLESRA